MSRHSRPCFKVVHSWRRYLSTDPDTLFIKWPRLDAVSEGALDKESSAIFRPPRSPTGASLSNLFKKRFTMGYYDSFAQWLRRHDLATADRMVLEFSGVPFEGPNAAKYINTPVGNGNFINELQVEGPKINGSPNKHIVLVHGYGASKGFFYKNIKALGTIPGYTLHALDLLGYGLSSRPKFPTKLSNKSVEGIKQAEGFFVDSLENWRQSKGIENFDMIAHSLGAYIGCSYAYKHSDRVNKILLASPAGVNRNAYSLPGELLGDPANLTDPTGLTAQAPQYFEWLWDKKVSPFVLVRKTGPLGPMFTSGWSSRRFFSLPLEEQKALQLYSYVMFNARGSGEYALSYLLAVGGLGRWPLAERVHQLKCPSLWVYGDRDWMDKRGGIIAAQRIRQNGGKATIVELENSGHHLYLDNYREFNNLAVQFVTKF